MSIGTGLAGSFGASPESTYGVFEAPTKWWNVTKSDIKRRPNVVQGGGLAGGRMAELGSRRVITHEDAGGTVDGMEVTSKGMNFWIDQIMGGSGAPVQQGAGPAYLLSRAVADNVGKSFSGQTGVPDTSGVVRPYTAKGCKVTAVTFSCERGGLLTMVPTIDARQLSEVETMAAPSEVTGVRPFHFRQLTVKLGTLGAEASIDGIKGMSLTLERAQDVERIYAGSNGLKSEPLMSDFLKVSGSLNADFLNKATLADRFAADSSFALIFEWVGPLIASTYYETFRIKLPMNFLDGDSPVLDGPGIVTGAFPFSTKLDGTNPLVTLESISVDTTL
jgi:hypothetical protein